ncbi:MAG: SMC-Scp complex subunit ScpB [Gammaproteobacteria bacterium]
MPQAIRLQVKQDYSPCLASLWIDKSNKLSKSLMETISIIAYKQPVTRGDIEDIRGVSVSTSTVRNLLEREWIKISGYRDVPGRPALYATTPNFLNDFNLKKISELPSLPEAEEVDEDFTLQAV